MLLLLGQLFDALRGAGAEQFAEVVAHALSLPDGRGWGESLPGFVEPIGATRSSTQFAAAVKLSSVSRDRVGERQGSCEQLQWLSEIVRRALYGGRVQVVTADRYSQPTHVQPQLVCPSRRGVQSVASQSLVVFEQLDMGLAVRFTHAFVGTVQAVFLDNAVAYGPWQHQGGVVGRDRFVDPGDATIPEHVLIRPPVFA